MTGFACSSDGGVSNHFGKKSLSRTSGSLTQVNELSKAGGIDIMTIWIKSTLRAFEMVARDNGKGIVEREYLS